jgi:Domain of unknown function (DUF1772)
MEATVRRCAQLSAVLNGVMLASQVRDQFRLVPMWERLGPEDFRTWFRHHAVRSARWHAPLLLFGLGSAAVAAGQSGRSRSRFLRLALVGVALHGGVTMFVHVPANAILVSARAPDRSDVLRKRWIRWHLIRVEMLAVGEGAALAALIRSRPSLSYNAGTK